jgi:hypothetical protein
LENLIDHLRNDQIIWEFAASSGQVTGAMDPRPKGGTPAYDVLAMFADPDVERVPPEDIGKPPFAHGDAEVPSADIQKGLLKALADPSKFIAAHYLLCRMSPNGYEKVVGNEQLNFGSGIDLDQKSVAVDFDGLKVICRTSWDEHERIRGEWIEIDPHQENTIQGMWHQRLDKLVAAVSFQRLIFAVLLIFLVCWVPVFKRRIALTWRIRHGRCPGCGYDLRASGNKCPECGAFIDKRRTIKTKT